MDPEADFSGLAKSAGEQIVPHLSNDGARLFQQFLRRISRALSTGYSHCGLPDDQAKEEDDVFHTLVRYEAFECDRECLV